MCHKMLSHTRETLYWDDHADVDEDQVPLSFNAISSRDPQKNKTKPTL